MLFHRKIWTIIKRQFLSGLLVTIPLIATYFVLRFLFNALDGLLNPIVRGFLGYNIPGLGAVVTLLLILLAGIITTNYAGALLYRWGDRLLARMPLIRVVYSATKQLMESVITPSTRAFSEVVLVEYPRRGVYAIGFLAGRSEIDRDGEGETMRLIFIPSTPTPFTGMVILVPEKDIYPIDMGVEEAIKLLVSGGIVTPPRIVIKDKIVNGEGPDAPGQSIG